MSRGLYIMCLTEHGLDTSKAGQADVRESEKFYVVETNLKDANKVASLFGFPADDLIAIAEIDERIRESINFSVIQRGANGPRELVISDRPDPHMIVDRGDGDSTLKIEIRNGASINVGNEGTHSEGDLLGVSGGVIERYGWP